MRLKRVTVLPFRVSETEHRSQKDGFRIHMPKFGNRDGNIESLQDKKVVKFGYLRILRYISPVELNNKMETRQEDIIGLQGIWGFQHLWRFILFHMLLHRLHSSPYWTQPTMTSVHALSNFLFSDIIILLLQAYNFSYWLRHSTNHMQINRRREVLWVDTNISEKHSFHIRFTFILKMEAEYFSEESLPIYRLHSFVT